jgi:hypothetical protein
VTREATYDVPTTGAVKGALRDGLVVENLNVVDVEGNVNLDAVIHVV